MIWGPHIYLMRLVETTDIWTFQALTAIFGVIVET